MRHHLKALILLTVIVGLILTGCSPATPAPTTGGTAPTKAPATKAPPTAEPPAAAAEVNLWTYYGDTGPAAACVKTAGDDFNAAQSAYVLKIRNLAFTDFNQQITTAIAAGATPDLMIVDNPDNARYAAAGALADLTDKVKAWGRAINSFPVPGTPPLWQGKNFGIPLGSNTVVLWINTDMANAAGLDIANPPKTWDEFETWAGKMTDKDNGVYGTAMLAKKDETGTFLFLPWVLQNGGNIDNLASPEAVGALAFWKKLIDEGYAPKSADHRRFCRDLSAIHHRQGGHDDQRHLERQLHSRRMPRI